MIESGFSTGATSYVSAAGLWQFMSYTGRDYGLRIDWWVDERRDPEASTRAALRYLSDLQRMFAGDWWLSWASYNGGQGRVMRATRAAGSTDFWTLARGSYLHSETDNYVPKLIAAAIIGKHPERYGFVGIKYQPAFTFDTVTVPASTNVAVLAKCAGITQEAFLDYNPALRRFALPPDPATQKIRIPAGASASFQEALAKVPEEERITRLQRHVVKRGQSLASVARTYKVSVAELARANHITTKTRLRVGTELVIPVAGSTAEEVGAPPAQSTPKPVAAADSKGGGSTTAKAAKAAPPTTHVVKPGDTLGAIATRYGATQKEIQSWNGMKGTVVKVGQKLVVSAPASAAVTSAPAPAVPAAKPAAAARTGKTVRYTVRRGDTLASIADRYDCTVADIKAWNGLKGSTIYVGQKLKIKD
jgi:membrane-bound lytic murein transglycosylase D